MGSGDFNAVRDVVDPNVRIEWPQSDELIRGVDNFVAMNAEYPASGPWVFTINRIVGGDGEAVSDVSITDSVQRARAISFFTITDGRISRIVEFWPEPFEAAPNRAHLTERLV
jgi:ketosteroid isomerase-like protein